jgi:DNA-3-methyladenine glycosylase
MYAEGGVAYVYLCYGVHHLFNFVTSRQGIPHAILLRGIYPVEGVQVMEKRLGKRYSEKGFTDGPGKLSKALGIRIHHTGEGILGKKIWVEDRGFVLDHREIIITPRIGVDYAGEDAHLPYRFVVNLNGIKKSRRGGILNL